MRHSGDFWGGFAAMLFIGDPFRGLIWSQVLLSMQLPFTIFALIALTSSREMMGSHANGRIDKGLLWIVAAVVTALNVALLVGMLAPK